MSINISDIVISFGQSNQINWIKDALIPCFSVFLGAILAHNFNINRDKIKKVQEICEKMNVLCNKSDFLLGSLMSYNEFLVEKIEMLFNENVEKAAINPIYIPDISCFNISIEEYAFLSNYNTRFLYTIEQLKKQLQLLESCAQTYKNKIQINSIKINENFLTEDDIKQTIDCLKTLRDALNPSIEFAYVLNCQLNKCCIRYFNFLCIENIQEINYIKESYKKYMSGIDDAENVKELNKAFSNFWIIPHNFNSIVAFWLRKIKFKFRFFCYFFSFDKFFK